jgi:integrase
MAHIRKLDTTQRRNGRTVSHYEVRWSEITIAVDGGRRKRYKQETFPTRTLAEARLAEIESERAATGAVTGREARLEPFAAFAFAWLDSLAGTVKARTLAEYRRLYDTYVAPEFATRPIGAVSPADARRFRADLVNKGLARGTIKHAFDVFRRIMDVAVQDGAIPANPAASVPLPRTTATGDTPVFAPHPLTSDQVARISAHIGARHKVYGLVVLFLAYTGLRAGELAGLEVQDLDLTKHTIKPSNAPSGRCGAGGRPAPPRAGRVGASCHSTGGSRTTCGTTCRHTPIGVCLQRRCSRTGSAAAPEPRAGLERAGGARGAVQEPVQARRGCGGNCPDAAARFTPYVRRA